MMKKMLLVGIASIAVVVLLYRCTKIEYNNPIDIEGTNKEYLLAHPEALLDTNNNNIADLLEDPLYNRDTTKPVIRINGGDTVHLQVDDPSNQMDNFYLDPSKAITVTDAGGGPINKLTPQHNVNVYKINVNPYTITYTAQDSSGNTATATRYVFIEEAPEVDTKPPTLTLSEDTMYITQGGTFTDPGVTAFDLKDGDLRSQVVKTGTVDVNTPGPYTIHYTVSDKSGNSASVDRVVIVQPLGQGSDNVPPTITLIGADTLFVPTDQTIVEYEKTYVEPGYTATDNVDGDITANVKVSTMTQLSTQYWVINYNVTDAAGNSATPRRRFINTGRTNIGTAPVIELTLPDSVIQIILGNKWNEPGYLAVDMEEGDITEKVVVNDTNVTNNINKPGTYQVVYMVTNSNGLTTQKIRFVSITESACDTQGPVITLKGRNPDTVLIKSAASYTDPGYTAVDNRDGDVTNKVSKSGTVNMNAIGSYKITYTATDAATNRGSATRTVWVVRDTTSNDLLVVYAVPSEKALPDMKSRIYMNYEVDGTGPNLNTIKKMNFSWDAINKQLSDFAFELTVDPYYKSITQTVKQNFDQKYPEMTLTGTGIAGLDGKYYVSLLGNEFFWVEQSGKYAIIWTP